MEDRSIASRAGRMQHARPVLLAGVALTAFAANSLLCRLALGAEAIDAVSFTVIRIGAGALALGLLVPALGVGSGIARVQRVRQKATPGKAVRWRGVRLARWRGAVWLWVYALPFSLAYTRLEAGTGALLLFGAVQLSMFGAALRAGERPSRREWVGLLGAFVGLTYLVAPGLRAPDPWAAASMVVAGVGWAAYSIEGKRSGEPMLATAENFRRAALLMVPVGLLIIPIGVWIAPSGMTSGTASMASAGALGLAVSRIGILFALASGVVASAFGYVAWYAALRYLTATRAALVQLAVPIWTAVGAVVLLDEVISLRLLIAGALVLGSLAYATQRPRQLNDSRP